VFRSHALGDGRSVGAIIVEVSPPFLADCDRLGLGGESAGGCDMRSRCVF